MLLFLSGFQHREGTSRLPLIETACCGHITRKMGYDSATPDIKEGHHKWHARLRTRYLGFSPRRSTLACC